MNKRISRHSLAVLLIILLTGLFSLALAADPELTRDTFDTYLLYAPKLNEEGIMQAAFGDRTEEIIRQETGYGTLWMLKGEEGLPFARLGWYNDASKDFETEFMIYRRDVDANGLTYYLDGSEWNAIPEESGWSAPQAKEMATQARAFLSDLGLINGPADAEPLYFSAMGRMEGTAKCYQIVFRETLNGLPIHWANKLLAEDQEMDPGIMTECCAKVVYSEEGDLLRAEGVWTAFLPAPIQAKEGISTEEARVRLAADQDPENCYYLSMDGFEVSAVLAWRDKNSYIKVSDGSWLQE